MARQAGLVKYIGTMGGIRHYRLKGRDEWYASMKSGPTREQVLKGKEFERTRETMREFGGVAKAAGAFRKGIGSLKKRFGDTGLNQRIMKKMYSIMRKDSTSERGKRVVRLSKHRLGMAGFEWNGKKSLESALNGRIEVKWQNERKATVKIENGRLNAPDGATHARIVVVMHTASDLYYDEAGHQMFKNYAGNEKSATEWSEYIDVENEVNEEIRVELGAELDLKDCGVFVSIGVEFYEEAGDFYYAMREGGSMRTVAANTEEKENVSYEENADENVKDGEVVTDKEDRFFGRARFKKE